MCELCEAGRVIQGIHKEKPDPFSEMEIKGDKLCVDLSGCDHEYGEFLIKYCPMCGRKLEVTVNE